MFLNIRAKDIIQTALESTRDVKKDYLNTDMKFIDVSKSQKALKITFSSQGSVASKRTREANPASQNSSFIFTCNVQAVPILLFSTCLGTSTFDRKRISRNPLLKLEKWPGFLFTDIFN